MTTTKEHTHRATAGKTITKTFDFEATNEEKQVNRRAHGGVVDIETCRCGATRRICRNGRHEERGDWTS
jgi:hypothetical protein